MIEICQEETSYMLILLGDENSFTHTVMNPLLVDVLNEIIIICLGNCLVY